MYRKYIHQRILARWSQRKGLVWSRKADLQHFAWGRRLRRIAWSSVPPQKHRVYLLKPRRNAQTPATGGYLDYVDFLTTVWAICLNNPIEITWQTDLNNSHPQKKSLCTWWGIFLLIPGWAEATQVWAQLGRDGSLARFTQQKDFQVSLRAQISISRSHVALVQYYFLVFEHPLKTIQHLYI